jgi:hypothetical protein
MENVRVYEMSALQPTARAGVTPNTGALKQHTINCPYAQFEFDVPPYLIQRESEDRQIGLVSL